MRHRIAHLLVLACLALPTVSGQCEPPQPGTRLEQLQQRLNLSEDQRAMIRPILVEEAGKLQDIRAKYEGQRSRRSRRKMLRELRGGQQSIEKRLHPILTRQQQGEWNMVRQERRDELRAQRR